LFCFSRAEIEFTCQFDVPILSGLVVQGNQVKFSDRPLRIRNDPIGFLDGPRRVLFKRLPNQPFKSLAEALRPRFEVSA
jgi:hypothetical protein